MGDSVGDHIELMFPLCLSGVEAHGSREGRIADELTSEVLGPPELLVVCVVQCNAEK